jgi:alpha-glucosidase
VPLPWTRSLAEWHDPWLPVPASFAGYSVEAESADPGSMLSLYRTGLRMRRAAPWGDAAAVRFLDGPAHVLAFARGDRFTCLVNFGPDPAELPPGVDVLIASNELEGGAIPADTTVWLSPNANGKEGR